MGQKVTTLLIAIAKATPLNPHQGAKRTPSTTQPAAQRRRQITIGSSRSTPQSICPDIIRHTATAVYIKSQRTRWESGSAAGPAQIRIRGFETRASAAARGTPNATDAKVAFL